MNHKKREGDSMRIIRTILICMMAVLIQGCAHDQKSNANSEQDTMLEERLATAQVTEKRMDNGSVFTSIEFAGNLEPNADLGCIPISQVTSEFNPPALIYASRKCIEKEEYSRAWELLFLGSGFAYYDLKRLADRSTQGAGKVLMMEAFGDLTSAQNEMMSKVSNEMQADPEQVQSYCAEVTRIGPPTYEPEWAIYHGIGVYDEPRNGHYLTNVDTRELWEEVVKNRCTPIKPHSVEETINTMIEILREGDGNEFCVPNGRTMLEIAKDLLEYSKNPNGNLTTAEMKIAFKELYPCK